MQVKKRVRNFPRDLIDAVTLDGLRLDRISGEWPALPSQTNVVVVANLKVERYVSGGGG